MSLLQNKALLPAVIVVAAAGIAGVVYFQNAGNSDPIASAVDGERLESPAVISSAEAAEGSELITPRVLGDPDAPVEIIEYSSLTCPHCASFHRETLPQIKKEYIDTGKAKLVSRDYPLDERAALGTLLARCAPEDRYFPLVDLLFAQQRSWAGSNDILNELARIGGFAGMSQDAIQQCFENQDLYTAILNQRSVWRDTHDISSTPTFYINGTAVVGAQPFAEFQKVIESELE